MRINARTKLTEDDLYAAASVARANGYEIYIEESATSPRGAITFYGESYTGKRRTNRRGHSDAYAASWAAWGWLLAELFNRDPEAVIGQYKGREDFREQCASAHSHRLLAESASPGVMNRTEYGKDISFLDHLNDRTGVAS